MTSNGLAETSNHIQLHTGKVNILMFFRAREMNFKVDGAKEHWKVLSVTIVGR